MAMVTSSGSAIEAFNTDAKVDMAVIIFQLVLAGILILKSESFALFAISPAGSIKDLQQ